MRKFLKDLATYPRFIIDGSALVVELDLSVVTDPYFTRLSCRPRKALMMNLLVYWLADMWSTSALNQEGRPDMPQYLL